MNIYLSSEMALLLETIIAETKGLEFSGFGYAKWDKDVLAMYDFVLLNVGSSTYTEISGEQMAKLADREDAKNLHIWVHRHPVGDGIPGYQNWSSTDEDTIWHAPLGSDPVMMKWAAAIVRTPRGWVGRIDDIARHITLHVDVLPHVSQELFDQVRTLQKKANDELYRLPRDAHFVPLGAESYDASDIIWDEPDYTQESFYEAADALNDATSRARRKAKSRKDPWWKIW